MSDRGRLVGPAGPAPPRCRLAGLLLALLAVLAALWSHPVLFDLRPGRYGDAMALFQGGQAEVDIDARAPEARSTRSRPPDRRRRLAPPHQDRGQRHLYRVRVPARETAGPWTLTLTNENGSWVVWDRLRLVEARATPPPLRIPARVRAPDPR